MKRYHWAGALSDLVIERMRVPFSWGVNDCCLFAADAVLAQTGQDHAEHLRGKYATAREAANLLAMHGGLGGIADAALRMRINPMMAQIGDVVMVKTGHDGRESLAVCIGMTAVAPGELGLEHIPMSGWVKGWRVGGDL